MKLPLGKFRSWSVAADTHHWLSPLTGPARSPAPFAAQKLLFNVTRSVRGSAGCTCLSATGAASPGSRES